MPYPIKAIIISFNTKKMTGKCLAKLHEMLCLERDKIVLVDNGSSDGTVEFVQEKFPQVHCIPNSSNRGFARACNQAIFLEEEDCFYLFVNSDVIPDQTTLEGMRKFLESQGEAACVSAQLCSENGLLQNTIANFPNLLTEIFGKAIFQYLFPSKYPSKRFNPDNPTSIESVVGAFMMIRGESLQKIGGFDERFYFFLEETDLCRRLKQLGQENYLLPQFKVIHLQGGTAKFVPLWARFQYYRSLYQFILKWEGRGKMLVLYAVNFLHLPLKILIYGLLSGFACINNSFKRKVLLSLFLLVEHIKGFPFFPLQKHSLLLNLDRHALKDKETVRGSNEDWFWCERNQLLWVKELKTLKKVISCWTFLENLGFLLPPLRGSCYAEEEKYFVLVFEKGLNCQVLNKDLWKQCSWMRDDLRRMVDELHMNLLFPDLSISSFGTFNNGGEPCLFPWPHQMIKSSGLLSRAKANCFDDLVDCLL